jgi:hypothetical protein
MQSKECLDQVNQEKISFFISKIKKEGIEHTRYVYESASKVNKMLIDEAEKIVNMGRKFNEKQ